MARMTIEAQSLVGQKGPRLPAKEAPYNEWVRWKQEHLGAPAKAEGYKPHDPVEIEVNGAKVPMRLPAHLDATLREKVAAIGGTQADYNHLAGIVLQEIQQAPVLAKSILEKTYGAQGAQQITMAAQRVLDLIPDVGESGQPGLRSQVKELIASSPELQVGLAHIASRLGESQTPAPGWTSSGTAVDINQLIKEAQQKDAEWVALMQSNPNDPRIPVLQEEVQKIMYQVYCFNQKKS